MSDQSDYDEKAQFAFRTIENHFKHVEDYRRAGSVKHRLLHILFFTLCAVTAGSVQYTDIGNSLIHRHG